MPKKQCHFYWNNAQIFQSACYFKCIYIILLRTELQMKRNCVFISFTNAEQQCNALCVMLLLCLLLFRRLKNANDQMAHAAKFDIFKQIASFYIFFCRS